jgi:uracil phosphoribosyltransferase
MEFSCGSFVCVEEIVDCLLLARTTALYSVHGTYTRLPSMSHSRLRISDPAMATAETAMTAIFTHVPS